MAAQKTVEEKLITYNEEVEDLDSLIKRIRQLSSPRKRKLTHFLQNKGPILIDDDEEIVLNKNDVAHETHSSKKTIAVSDSKPEKKKASYSEEERKEALKIAAEKGNFNLASKIMRAKTAKKFDESSIREWSELYVGFFKELQDAYRHKKRVIDKVSPYNNMEEELISWIKEERLKHVALKRYDIQRKARDISGDPSFAASDGWFSRFCKRWALRRRMPTHQIQKLKEDSWSSVVSFFEDIRKERLKVEILNSVDQYEKCVFINMDEMALQFDSAGHTYDFKGKKEINILSNTAKKRRFTVVLTTCSDGRCFPPMVIFKGRVPLSQNIKTRFDGCALLTVNSSGWMSNEKMRLWIEKTLLNFKREEKTKYFVILDHFSAHISESTRDLLKTNGFELFVIPAGFTGFMQPLDTCIMHPLKARLRSKYNSWLNGQTQTDTKNILPPSYEQVVTWIKSCWADIPTSLHSKSFKHCGISNAIDGSERDLINSKILSKSEVNKWISDTIQRGAYSIHDHDNIELREQLQMQTTYDLIPAHLPAVEEVAIESGHANEENTKVDEVLLLECNEDEHMDDDEVEEDPGYDDPNLQLIEEDRPAHMIQMLRSFYTDDESSTQNVEGSALKRKKKKDTREINQPAITLFFVPKKKMSAISIR
jgi:hypothetical protein